MPAILTTYRQYMRSAIQGMIADETPVTIATRVVQTAGGIPFGAIACQGTNDNQIIVAAANKVYVGVTVINPAAIPSTPTVTQNQYNFDDDAAVMLRGTVWVTVNVTVTAGAAAGFDPATGNFNLSTTSGATAIPNGRYDTSAASGSLAKLRLV